MPPLPPTGYYGSRRWGIEWAARCQGFTLRHGARTVHVKSPERRDRLWLINAFAVVLLTLLGAAGEAPGYDRMLKTNTSSAVFILLFRQGCMLYDLIPNSSEDWPSAPLMQRSLTPLQQPLFTDVFGPV